jgi:hypothetical protein
VKQETILLAQDNIRLYTAHTQIVVNEIRICLKHCRLARLINITTGKNRQAIIIGKQR